MPLLFWAIILRNSKGLENGLVVYQYDRMLKLLVKHGLTRTALTSELGLSSRTVAKIGKGEKLSTRTLERIAAYLSCDVAELYEEVSDNPVLRVLRQEKEARVSGGLYHELQVRMTYNSNHMEGSTLTQEQTRLIFETSTIDAGDGIPVDDIPSISRLRSSISSSVMDGE